MAIPGAEAAEPGKRRLTPLRRLDDARFWALAGAVAFWAILLAALVAVKSDVAGKVVALLVAVSGTVAVWFAARYKQTTAPTLRRAARPAATLATLLAADLVFSGGWIGWSVYRANRSFDVKAQILISGRTHLYPSGSATRPEDPQGHEVATVDVAITHPRDALVLVFNVVDSFPKVSSCTPNTRLRLTPTQGGNPSDQVTATPLKPAAIPLSPDAKQLHLDIQIVNLGGDHNCAVDIAVAGAELTND
ncbi:MAG: hypothetical protein JF587_03220 [Catenulisporales bacterium]|jgi:hypothetical protein|nr:hypothetical protein [Catenulisporales bacterium]